MKGATAQNRNFDRKKKFKKNKDPKFGAGQNEAGWEQESLKVITYKSNINAFDIMWHHAGRNDDLLDFADDSLRRTRK